MELESSEPGVSQAQESYNYVQFHEAERDGLEEGVGGVEAVAGAGACGSQPASRNRSRFRPEPR